MWGDSVVVKADVLIVEDNREVVMTITSILKGICNVFSAATLSEAKSYCSNKPFDLIMLDLSLPDGSGFDLIPLLNELTKGKAIPFLLISGDISAETQVTGFSMGAEDYVTKPFNPFILRARVINCLRRVQNSTGDEINLGKIVVSRKEFRAFKKALNGDRLPIDLTTLEFRLLSVFIDHLGNALNRQNLIDLVWGSTTNVVDRVVDQHICSLRKKLKDSGIKIRSLYGYGYRMEALELTNKDLNLATPTAMSNLPNNIKS
jgi:DNA-binding response OmpR family regulator